MATTFVSIWFILVAAMLSPGANVLITQPAASDRTRSAAFGALGMTVGAGIWATSAVLGINVLFQSFRLCGWHCKLRVACICFTSPAACGAREILPPAGGLRRSLRWPRLGSGF